MADSATRDSFCGGVSKFLDSAGLSDLTITCSEHKWVVHRFCIALHSSVLAKACTGEFEAGVVSNNTTWTELTMFQEGQQETFDLSEYSKDQVTAPISYLYKFDYGTTWEEHSQRMCFHIATTILVDKYDIPGLKTLATKKFQAIIEQTKTATGLSEATALACSAETATSKIRKDITLLVAKREAFMPGGAEGDVMEKVVDNYPHLAADIIKALKQVQKAEKAAEDPTPRGASRRRFHCPGCTKVVKAHFANSHHNTYTCPHCNAIRSGNQWIQKPVV